MNQNGRSMVEMLGVLAIIGVLSVGGIAGYSKAMAKYKASRAMDQLSLLVANIRATFATMANYKDLDNVSARKYSIASRDMYGTSSGHLLNAFGGNLVLDSEPYPRPDGLEDSGFKIEYHGLNEEACIQLATSDWGTGGFDSIEVGTETFDVSQMPISLADAYTYCKATDGNKTATIIWHFY